MHQNSFSAGGFAPDPAEGACDAPPTPSSAGEVPLLIPFLLRLEAFGVSISSPHQRRLGS